MIKQKTAIDDVLKACTTHMVELGKAAAAQIAAAEAEKDLYDQVDKECQALKQRVLRRLRPFATDVLFDPAVWWDVRPPRVPFLQLTIRDHATRLSMQFTIKTEQDLEKALSAFSRAALAASTTE
jgi:hypothetical protein